MTRVLLVSGDPLGPKMAGPGIRAVEVARALQAAGLDVALASPGGEGVPSALGGGGAPTAPGGAGTPTTPEASPDRPGGGPSAGLETISYGVRGERLRAAAENADAIVVGGLVLAQYPFLSALGCPLVVDLYAPFVLENLPAGAAGGSAAKARRRRHAGDVAALTWQLERGDFFMCASEIQRDFWLGCLTTAGRVNPDTYGADPDLRRLIDLVPFGLPEGLPTHRRNVMRGVVPGIGEDDQIILWGGGLWDWLDPLTLVSAVGRVAEERDDVRLVFMGSRSPNPGVPPSPMADRARALARDLGLLDSRVFVLDDWVPYDDRAGYLLEADIGASLHRPHIESRFAFRTRLLDYVWTGLPMVVSEGDVLSQRVDEYDLGRVVPTEDVSAVADAIWSLLAVPGGRLGFAPRFDTLRRELTWTRAVQPLVEFLESPVRAPDQPVRGDEPDALASTPLSALPSRALETLREGGPWLLLEETARYVRWRRRPR